MNHKRGRPKNQRRGYWAGKYYKGNGFKGTHNAQTVQERKAREAEAEALAYETQRTSDERYDADMDSMTAEDWAELQALLEWA